VLATVSPTLHAPLACPLQIPSASSASLCWWSRGRSRYQLCTACTRHVACMMRPCIMYMHGWHGACFKHWHTCNQHSQWPLQLPNLDKILPRILPIHAPPMSTMTMHYPACTAAKRSQRMPWGGPPASWHAWRHLCRTHGWLEPHRLPALDSRFCTQQTRYATKRATHAATSRPARTVTGTTTWLVRKITCTTTRVRYSMWEHGMKNGVHAKIWLKSSFAIQQLVSTHVTDHWAH